MTDLKQIHHLLIICLIIIICNSIFTSAQQYESKRYESMLYGSLSSIGHAVYLQSDIGVGVNVLQYINSALTLNMQYRNYSFVTNDYLSVSGRIKIMNHELRPGLTAGLYTVRIGEYRDIVGCYGAECVYSYAVTQNTSLRLKERIVWFTESGSPTIATSTLIGFCFSF